MAYPDYFSRFPNIKYPYRINRAGILDTFTIKDYFHLLKVREDILATDTIYSPMTIRNGERPDQLSYRLYGNEAFYWIILQINEIVDVHNEWPLGPYELDEYILKKYGSIEKSNEVHHYETIETFDKEGQSVSYQVEVVTPPSIVEDLLSRVWWSLRTLPLPIDHGQVDRYPRPSQVVQDPFLHVVLLPIVSMNTISMKTSHRFLYCKKNTSQSISERYQNMQNLFQILMRL